MDISTATLDTLKSRKDLFFLGFDSLIRETDNITGITGGMKISQALVILRPLVDAEVRARAAAAGTGAPGTPTAGAPAAAPAST